MLQPSEGILFLKIQALKLLATRLDSSHNKVGFRLLFYRKLRGIIEYSKWLPEKSTSVNQHLQLLESITTNEIEKYYQGTWLPLSKPIFWIILIPLLMIAILFMRLPDQIALLLIVILPFVDRLVGFSKQKKVLESMVDRFRQIEPQFELTDSKKEDRPVITPQKEHIIFNLDQKEKFVATTTKDFLELLSSLDDVISISLATGFGYFLLFTEVSITGISRSLLVMLISFLLFGGYKIISGRRSWKKKNKRLRNHCVLFYNPVKDISVRPIFWLEQLHKVDTGDLKPYVICEISIPDALMIQTQQVEENEINTFIHQKAIRFLDCNYFSGLVAKETASGLTLFSSGEYFIPSKDAPMLFPEDLKCFPELKELFHYCGWL